MNTIHNINSCGFAARQNCEINFHDNILYANNISLRLHNLDFDGDTGTVNIYKNKIYAPLGSGFAFYLFWQNSENSSNAAPSGEVRIYHNSVSGGEYGFCMDSGGYEFLNAYGLPTWQIYNNIIYLQAIEEQMASFFYG